MDSVRDEETTPDVLVDEPAVDELTEPTEADSGASAEEPGAVRELTRRAWNDLLLEHPGRVPQVRAVHDRARALGLHAPNYTKIAGEVQRLRAEVPASAVEPSAVAAALAQIAEAERQTAAYRDRRAAAEDELVACDAAIVELERRAIGGDVEATQAIEAAHAKRWNLHRKLDRDLPTIEPELKAAFMAGHEALVVARREEIRLGYNARAAGQAALWDDVLADMAKLFTSACRLRANTADMRELAAQIGVPFLEDAPAPERLLASLFHLRFGGEVAPAPPAARLGGATMLFEGHVRRLPSSDAACRPLSPQDVQDLQGTGRQPVWLIYHGKDVLSLASAGVRAPLETQSKLQHGQPTQLSATDFQRLREFLPNFAEVTSIVPAPVWG